MHCGVYTIWILPVSTLMLSTALTHNLKLWWSISIHGDVLCDIHASTSTLCCLHLLRLCQPKAGVCAGRFNERLVLSLASNPAVLMMDDELNILPTSSHVRQLQAPAADSPEAAAAAARSAELKDLKETLSDTQVSSASLLA